MHKSLQNRFPQERVDGRRNNFFFRQEAQRQIPGTPQTHRSIKFLSKIFIHRHSCTRLNQLLQQDKAHTTITIPFILQRSIGYFLEIFLFERLVQPKAVTYLQSTFIRTCFRSQPRTETEFGIDPCLSPDAGRMHLVRACLKQRAIITVFINSILIEQQSRRQTGLME